MGREIKSLKGKLESPPPTWTTQKQGKGIAQD